MEKTDNKRERTRTLAGVTPAGKSQLSNIFKSGGLKASSANI